MSEMTDAEQRFAVCVENADYQTSLERHKIYRTLPDNDAKAHGYVRVIDESGEDYLYPKAFFVPIEPSEKLRTALLHAA